MVKKVEEKSMKYGYCRVSTKGQAREGNGLEAQERAVREVGAAKIYLDSFTGVKTSRPELDKLLQEIQSGDTLIITKIDRIARTATQGFELVQSLLNRGVNVHVLNMGLIDQSPTGKLILHIMLAFAEFERDMIVDRTTEGKAVARANAEAQGKKFYEGPPQKFSREQIDHALQLLENHSYSEVSRMTGISKSTLIRNRKQSCG